MTDYTLTLTPDEFDELFRCLRLVEKTDAINLICNEHDPSRAALRERNAIQNKIIGKMMDAERRRKEAWATCR